MPSFSTGELKFSSDSTFTLTEWLAALLLGATLDPLLHWIIRRMLLLFGRGILQFWLPFTLLLWVQPLVIHLVDTTTAPMLGTSYNGRGWVGKWIYLTTSLCFKFWVMTAIAYLQGVNTRIERRAYARWLVAERAPRPPRMTQAEWNELTALWPSEWV